MIIDKFWVVLDSNPVFGLKEENCNIHQTTATEIAQLITDLGGVEVWKNLNPKIHTNVRVAQVDAQGRIQMFERIKKIREEQNASILLYANALADV